MNYPIAPRFILATLRILLRQFTSPAIVILLLTALIYGALGNEHDALVLFAIIIPSGLLTFIQEYRAESTLKRLAARLVTRIRVLRSGAEIELSVEELIPGDEIALAPGDVIPADLIIVESQNLTVDESVLTGESMPRRKSLEGDRELFMGTNVVSGRVTARVVRTKSESNYGEMVSRIAGINVETSFEKGVRDFGFLVARAILVLVALVFSGNLLLQRPLFESLLFSLALAVGLTPQMLPVIISVCLSTGARHLAQEKVLIRRLDAIEDLGTLEVLCTDKTGTLTVGELRMDRAVDISGELSDRVGQLAFENAVLQSSSTNAIDNAIRMNGIGAVRAKAAEIEFSFQRRRVSVITEDGELICKGAVAEVLSISNRVRVGGEIKAIDGLHEEIAALNRRYAAAGYKVIAVASAYTTSEAALIFEGFILISDPPKAGAIESLGKLKDLGIDLYLVTGDSAETALHIANAVGIKTDLVLRGNEYLATNPKYSKATRVFAEFDPTQKADLVEALRKSGKVVGFLGDGINDAAALRSADVAISVEDAVDVAKSASAVVLLEKDLDVIADGVRIGRKTFENTMKYVRITISASFGNVLSMAIASFFLPFLPMLPTQILLLNFFSDLPAIAISSDRVDVEDLGSARHWTMRGIGHFMILFGVVSTIFDLALFAAALGIFDADAGALRSAWFATSLITEVIAILLLRTRRRSWRSLPSGIVVAISIFVTVIVIAVPALGIFATFGLPAISIGYLALIAILALGYAASIEFLKSRTGLMR